MYALGANPNLTRSRIFISRIIHNIGQHSRTTHLTRVNRWTPLARTSSAGHCDSLRAEWQPAHARNRALLGRQRRASLHARWLEL